MMPAPNPSSDTGIGPVVGPVVGSDDPDQRLEQILSLTEILTERLVKECKAFEANRPLEVSRTLAETTRLANLYRHESRRIREAPQFLQSTPRESRLRLITATEAFDAVLARHGRAIGAAKQVTEGLVRAIAEEVVASRCTGSGYGPSAQKNRPSSTAVTLNQSA